MICYTLKCDQNHSFESWFKSADAFDALLAAGHVRCAVCGSAKVEKGLMAPAVRASAPDKGALSAPQNPVEEALAAMRRHLDENSEYVGLRFADEARSIHEGDSPNRSIYGEARREDAIKLIEDGIAVTPLPLMPRPKTN